MRRRLRLLASLLSLSFLLLPAVPSKAQDPLSGIKGMDDRIDVNARAYPWSAIGRLSGPAGLRCTGTLIGPSLAVTAAHCLWDAAANDWARADDLSFAAGWTAGWRMGTALVSQYDIASGYQRHLEHWLGRGANDWAFLHLSAPLGLTAGWLGLSPLAPATWNRLAAARPVIIQAGYSADRPLTLSAHVGCHLLGWPEPGLVAHDCDATEGDSGAPIFAWVDGAFRLLGLHVATFRRAPGEPFGGADFGAAVPASAYAQSAVRNGAQANGSAAGAPLPTGEVGGVLARLGYGSKQPGGLSAAVRAFQRDHHLPETGEASASVLGEALNALR